MIIYVIVFLKIENSGILCCKLLINTSVPLKCKLFRFDLWLYYACIEINHFSLVSPTEFPLNNESNKKGRLQQQDYPFLRISRHFHGHLLVYSGAVTWLVAVGLFCLWVCFAACAWFREGLFPFLPLGRSLLSSLFLSFCLSLVLRKNMIGFLLWPFLKFGSKL